MLVKKKEECCGCSACKSICPKQAISMEPDVLGFLYPKIDEKKCINCGLCEKVCSFNDSYDISLNFSEPLAFGVRHRNMKEIETSRSGAAFIALSDWILDNGGSVYGAGYKDHFRVAHKRAQTKTERDEFKGSKYVQSDVGDCFKQVKEDLKNGLYVLFSGTPCQVAGLKSFIGRKLYEKLYLIDIVCHGVPGPYIWRDYLDYLERKEGKIITSVNFRDKSRFGWSNHRESFQFNNTYTKTYTYTFYQNIVLRSSCAFCHFTNLKRAGDITIADFWGWKKTNPNFNIDNKGCSLVLCNTQKGYCLFKDAQKDINFFSAKLENCIQPNLQHPTELDPKRESFEKDYAKEGFLYVMKKYGDFGINAQTQKKINFLKDYLKKKIKVMINKIKEW